MPAQLLLPAISPPAGGRRVDASDPRLLLRSRLEGRGNWRRRLQLQLIHSLALAISRSSKRWFDVAISILLLALLAPLLVTVAALTALAGGSLRIVALPKQGTWCRRFLEYRFDIEILKPRWRKVIAVLRLDRYPTLVNVLKGDMSVIGPRPVAGGEFDPRDRTARRRYEVKPGLLCLWWIRRRGNVAYETEVEIDEEYVNGRSFGGDLGIVLRALPALIYGESSAEPLPFVQLLGVRIDNLTMNRAVATIVSMLEDGGAHPVFFVNAHCLNLASRDRSYLRSLVAADLRLPDGIGLKLAGKLRGQPIRQNVNGTDLFPRLCEALDSSGKRVFLVGASPGVAEQVGQWIGRHYSGLKVCGHHHGYLDAGASKALAREIAAARTDLLLVAMGSPLQEFWIRRYLGASGAKVAIGVGGLFDFYSDRIPRAPQWMREIGLEWVCRLVQEPRRMWKRYLVGSAAFLWRVLAEKRPGGPRGGGTDLRRTEP